MSDKPTSDEMLTDLLENTNLTDWECEFVDDLDKQRRKASQHGSIFDFTQRQSYKIKEIWGNRVMYA